MEIPPMLMLCKPDGPAKLASAIGWSAETPMFTTEITLPFWVRMTVDRARMLGMPGPFDSSWIFGLVEACGTLDM